MMGFPQLDLLFCLSIRCWDSSWRFHESLLRMAVDFKSEDAQLFTHPLKICSNININIIYIYIYIYMDIVGSCFLSVESHDHALRYFLLGPRHVPGESSWYGQIDTYCLWYVLNIYIYMCVYIYMYICIYTLYIYINIIYIY